MRILLDTNIIISGFISSESPPGKLVQGWLDGRFELVTSQAQLDELLRALGYERLRDPISPEQARDFLENIEAAAIMVATVPEVDYGVWDYLQHNT